MFRAINISKKFNDKQIIDNFSLEVPNNKILCIVGPSGAGKSTLLRCLTGLESADSGEFYLNNNKFNPTNANDKKSTIGLVSQDFGLFPNLTVMENIILAPQLVLKLSKEEAIKKAKKLIRTLNLSGKEKLYPYQLSGGQKQRVAIVRTLAMSPKIICYDEPTSALDPKLSEEVGKILNQLKSNNIMQIVVTHDMDFAKQVADDIITVKPLP
ncbi:amino acid ABC transporter ATP-binding protein [Apilactobacillus xinyiensis]|uniref:ATP-binding cassette domain-containing protein n=1 Tax=Apilactobacillus xinyiensis TaxID=2841032 RepID=A0ABT0I1U3_9LACO|nr:ATP-binding cassette domain-containing protein [Apilactobacillus xinyiensis]MCK8624689.1 ATP-binding cassette domain-containing protein [Apilactobacillus xinyiensis]MCL0312356.1 ATP-binding cassette domain-containing protein [Apilactobacillus xinyiensis]MCL0318804.1 ATP-binding cassette domain-containing protein [Apilactobacillus xinyiensis]MCL0329954.1 ATP-binding cassette domain-containing protein [Apilactobacillus xinyiensis]